MEENLKGDIFTGGRAFRYSDFPEIERCHDKWVKMGDRLYDLEDDLDSGKIDFEDWEEEMKKFRAFERNVYAKVVYDEFYGKGIVIQERSTKKEIPFDEAFNGKFEDLSLDQRITLMAMIEIDGTHKLPAEYYDKKIKC